MAAPDKHVRIIARMARLQAGMTPDRKEDYTYSMGEWKYQWGNLTKDERAAATKAAADIHDMTPAGIKAAVAELNKES